MAGADPAPRLSAASPDRMELLLRVLSALVLAPLAIGIAYLDGVVFDVFWGLAAAVVFWEWTTLVAGDDRRSVLMVGGASLVLAVALVSSGLLMAPMIVLAIGAVGAAALATPLRRGWAAAGVPYAGAIAVGPIILRSDGTDGFNALIFLFLVVWVTDVFAYFIGRALGGPKLAASISPKKTWSGAIGGTAGAVLAAIAFARFFGLNWFTIGFVAVLLSVCAQAGDLFESALKRKFGAKDASNLIPGHGGLMDRLDGFVAAAVMAAVIGLVRGGAEAPAGGLLMW